MTIPSLTTRSLARLALLTSSVALVLSLTRGWQVPHAPVHTALAAPPTTQLAKTHTAQDAASALAYYFALQPEDFSTYTHPVYGFSFQYPKGFIVQDIQDDRGELMLVTNPAVGMGWQLFITPDDDTAPLTAARIRHDLPDMPMEEVVEFTLPDDTPAVRFTSHDAVLGDLGETWFRKDGHVFQLSVSAPDRAFQDAWLREIAEKLTFPAASQASAATP